MEFSRWFNWTVRYTGAGSSDTFTGAAYGNGRWTVVGNNFDVFPVGLVLGSGNATNWTLLRQDTNRRAYNGVAFGSNQWLVVGRAFPPDREFPAILVSSNGTTRTDRTAMNTNSISALCFASDRWVGVGERRLPQFAGQASIATSTNGLSWTFVVPGVSGVESGLHALGFGAGQWLATGYYYDAQNDSHVLTLTSTNGTTWSQRAGGVDATALGFGDDKWVAWAWPTVYTAHPSNLIWTAQSLPLAMTNGSISAIHFSNGLWVLAGSVYRPDLTNTLPVILTSPDGTNWMQRTVPIAHGSLAGLGYAQGQWVTVGSESIQVPECGNNSSQSALILSSPDGITWTRRETGLPRGPGVFRQSGLRSIIWTGDDWLVSGNYHVPIILTSPDAHRMAIAPIVSRRRFACIWKQEGRCGQS